ncbi:hypothetical protein V1527DRAFT_147737 [Lipomyces starkeyi]
MIIVKPLQIYARRRVLRPLFLLLSVSAKEIGDRVLFHTSPRFPARSSEGVAKSASQENVNIALSSDGILGGGAYRTKWNGDVTPLTKQYKEIDKDEVREKVWEHTTKVFQDISASGCFSC